MRALLPRLYPRDTLFEQRARAVQVAGQRKALGPQGAQIPDPDSVAGRVEARHALLELRRAIRPSPSPQPGDPAADFDHDLAKKRDSVFAPNPLGFLGAPKKSVRIAQEIVDLRSERQGEGEIERMAIAPRVDLGGPIRRQRLIRVADHP